MKLIKRITQSKRNLLILIIVIIGMLFFVQRSSIQRKQTIEKTKVKQGPLKEELTLSGEIDTQNKVTLRFQTSGRLAFVAVKEGQWVKKGQVIAGLDKQELQKRLNKQLNTFLSERYSFDQTKDDNKDKVVTDAIRRILDTSQNDLNNAVIDVELQKITLDLSTIITPISGVVTNVTAPIAGVNITPSQAEFEIVNPDNLFFTASADQTEVTKLREKMPVRISLDAFPDMLLSGEITTIAYTPKSGETSTAYEFNVAFNASQKENILRLGMTGDATIITAERKNALYVPIKYVKLDKSKPYVLVYKKNKLTPYTVTTGLETEDKIEISSGLNKNDLVYDQTQ